MILIIPDVHGRDFYEPMLQREWDHVIFLGDYLDPYPHEGNTMTTALERMQHIIEYKLTNGERVTLLTGNHDLHYSSPHAMMLPKCSRYDFLRAPEIEDLFATNRDLFSLAWETSIAGKRYMFSHAPVLQRWLSRHSDIIAGFDADSLNAILYTFEGDRALVEVSSQRGGMSDCGSMVWADINEVVPGALPPAAYQIVGHTQLVHAPIITNEIACLDCRRCFALDESGIHEI